MAEMREMTEMGERIARTHAEMAQLIVHTEHMRRQCIIKSRERRVNERKRGEKMERSIVE